MEGRRIAAPVTIGVAAGTAAVADERGSHGVNKRHLAAEQDVDDVLTALTSRCVELSGADGAGVLVQSDVHDLRVVGATTAPIELLERFQIDHEEGPCLDCYRGGGIVVANFVGESRWPRFAAESIRAGFPSMCAIPLGLGAVTVGSLNLFMAEPVRLSDADVALARALADVASMAIIVQELTPAATHEGQLQAALQRRVVVEQAVGMIAEGARVDVDEALRRLRAFARNNDRSLTDVADQVVARTLDIDLADGGRPT